MITSDYIKGYVSALDHLKEHLKENPNSNSAETVMYIISVRDSYKALVKELNENQDKKTSSGC